MSIEANIRTTREILNKEIFIPDYQRPYRWRNANVMQLIEDVHASMEQGKGEYRIGTVILYRPPQTDAKYEIVDGQQRLTTILLILKKARVLDELTAAKNMCYYSSSVTAILDNATFIEEWLRNNTRDGGTALSKYLLDNCKVAEIIVDDLSEAFQMFDTQNGRGKGLEVYNLLKAYHIRAMEQDPQDMKIHCDRSWENAAQYDATPDIQNDPNVDLLRQLFDEQLFKSRIWCRNENAWGFTKDDIAEFKGFTIDKNHPIDFPFQNPFLLQYMTEKFYQNVLFGTLGTRSRLDSGETEKANPFVNINQTIINGKAFFEYVQTYVELYKRMFIELGTYQLADFKEFFYLCCLTYGYDPANQEKWKKARMRTDSFRDTDAKTRRTGDTYLRETYKSLCFVLLDKFGEKVFRKYYGTLYRLVYRLRIQNHAVKFTAVMAAPTRIFSIMHRAKSAADLLVLGKMANDLKVENYPHADKIDNEHLVKFIQKGTLQ